MALSRGRGRQRDRLPGLRGMIVGCVDVGRAIAGWDYAGNQGARHVGDNAQRFTRVGERASGPRRGARQDPGCLDVPG